MCLLNSFELQLKDEDIYRAMGTRHAPPKPNPKLLQKIQEYRAESLSLLHCRFVYEQVPVHILSSGEVQLNHNTAVLCDSKYFQRASQAIVILLTVGSALEQRVKRLLIDGFLLESFILDAYANAALDEYFGSIRSFLAREASAKGCQLGYSLNPGCLLTLEDQQIIFSLLNEKAPQIDIFLRESFVMHPEKSCSYLIPLGENLAMPSKSRYACPICPSHKDCLFSPIGLNR